MNVDAIRRMAKMMGEEAFGEFIAQSEMNEDQVAAIHRALAGPKGAEGPPKMKLFHTSSLTTSIRAAAEGGEVTEEAVAYQLKRGNDGIALLFDVASSARCESIYYNVTIIMEGVLAAKVPLTADFCSTLLACSDIFNINTVEGVQSFIERIVDAEGLPESERAKVVRELQGLVSDYGVAATEAQKELFARYASPAPITQT